MAAIALRYGHLAILGRVRRTTASFRARHLGDGRLPRLPSRAMSASTFESRECTVEKVEARKALKATLKAVLPQAMAEQSEAIARRVCEASFFKESFTTAVYLTAPRLREVDTSEVVKCLLGATGAGKRVFVPVVQDSASNMHFLHLDSLDGLVEMPPFGIMEPTATYGDGSRRQNVLELEQPLDLILMPGLGFDITGGRLGRGGGYYDKFLETVIQGSIAKGWKPPLLVALAFREQLMEAVPMSAHDQRVDIIVTADDIHYCRPAA